MFYPVVTETAGTWDDMAIELVQEIGRRTAVITQGPNYKKNLTICHKIIISS